jgi:hypothetical protein
MSDEMHAVTGRLEEHASALRKASTDFLAELRAA